MKLRGDNRFTKTARVEGKKIFGYGTTPALAEADLARKLGLPTPSIKLDAGVTLYDLAREVWWPKLDHLAPLTKKRYVGVYWKFINKTLGNIPVKDITAVVLHQWLGYLERKNVSPYSRSYALNTLSALMTQAYNLDLIVNNPCSKVSVPVKSEKRKRTLTVQKALELLDKAKGSPIDGPIYLATTLGLRRGEIAGLKWEDLDRLKGELHIVRQRQAIRPLGCVDRELKTDGSRRTLYLPKEAIAEIDRFGNLDNEYICTYKGLPWVPNTIGDFWAGKKVLMPDKTHVIKPGFRDEVGLKDWHFHDLRHLAAGLLHAAGCDILTIAAVLGHKKPDMSLIYTTVEDSRRKEGSDLLSSLFSRQKEATTSDR